MTIAIKKKLNTPGQVCRSTGRPGHSQETSFAQFVELITNCNDSYSRIEDSGGCRFAGTITIEVQRKHANSYHPRSR